MSKATEKILKLKESVDKLFNEQLEGLRKKGLFNDIKNLPLYHINKLFENIAPALMEDNANNGIIRKYTKLLKEDKGLRREYWFVKTIAEAVKSNVKDGNLFLNEMMKFKAEGNNKEQLAKLGAIVCEGIENINLDNDSIEKLIDETKDNLFESVNFVYNNDSFKDIIEYTNNLKTITESIEKQPEQTTVTEVTENKTITDLNKIMENQTLEPWETAVVKDIVACRLGDKGYKALFEEYKQSCLNVINGLTEDSTIESYSQLVEMKDKLESKTYNEETLHEDLFKLSELKNTLKD